MKKILLLLLISISGYSQTLLKLKAIEYAPGSGYCIITNSLGVQTYTPCSSLSSTLVPTLQQVVTSSPTLTSSVLAQSPDGNTNFSIEDGAGYINSTDLTNYGQVAVGANVVTSQVNGTSHNILDGQIENTTPLLTYNGNTVATTNQLPVLTASTGITISGTTPNYTLSATGSGSTTILTASTNITISGTAPNYTISTPTQTTGLASLTGTETLTNKRITVRTSTTTTTATITVNSDSYDLVAVTTLSTATTFTAPTGTPTEGQGLIYRIKDNGTARALTFNSVFRFSSDVPAPTTTIVSKWMYIYFVYNLTDAKWDCLTIATNY